MTDAQQHIPEKLGKYEVIEEISRGNMGIVYLGYDPYEDAQVAIKVALSHSVNDPAAGDMNRKMFFNEAHAAGRLKHPNIVRMYDAGVEGDTCYIVMEYIQGGRTLREYIEPDNILPLRQVVEIAFKCAKALDYAHRQRVVHRDIKPSNIMVTEELDVKIGDFGVAHMHQDGDAKTQLAGIVGSPRYMSPEQIREEPAQEQSDLYSLGVVMYELFTGHRPFAAENFTSLMHKILEKEPAPPNSVRPDIPESLNRIVMTCLSKDKTARYKTGQDLAVDMSRAFDYLSISDKKIREAERFEQLRGLYFFRGFPEPQIREIYRASTWKEFVEGEDIITEGDVDDCFFIITDGHVEVKKGDRVIRSLKRGACFGEMGYLTKAKRSASIRAKSTTSLLKIGATSVSKISKSCQIRFLRVFLRILIGRLSATTEQTILGHGNGPGADT